MRSVARAVGVCNVPHCVCHSRYWYRPFEPFWSQNWKSWGEGEWQGLGGYFLFIAPFLCAKQMMVKPSVKVFARYLPCMLSLPNTFAHWVCVHCVCSFLAEVILPLGLCVCDAMVMIRLLLTMSMAKEEPKKKTRRTKRQKQHGKIEARIAGCKMQELDVRAPSTTGNSKWEYAMAQKTMIQ